MDCKPVKKSFRSVADMIKPEAPQIIATTHASNTIPITQLVPYAKHPFRLYEDERLDDMLRSIRDMGVLSPIIVRPQGDKYEILSGHNRANAATLAGITDIPAIIRTDLTDELAALIVTETNLVQRSFDDLRHSEKAIVLKHHLEAIKAQGKRKDILDEIKSLSESMEKRHKNEGENTDGSKEKLTSPQIGEKRLSAKETGEKYGLSKNSVARYIRLNFLDAILLELVDEGEISVSAGVELSFLNDNEQNMLSSALTESHYKVDIKKAEILRAYSVNNKLTPTKIVQILSGKSTAPKALPTFKLRHTVVEKFFKQETKPKEIEETIEKALTMYFESRT